MKRDSQPFSVSLTGTTFRRNLCAGYLLCHFPLCLYLRISNLYSGCSCIGGIADPRAGYIHVGYRYHHWYVTRALKFRADAAKNGGG